MKTERSPYCRLLCITMTAFCLAVVAHAQTSTPVAAGFRDFSFNGSGATTTPTGEKPESKLWWNDGTWWGSLYSVAATDYHIYRFDPNSESWIDTGTALDPRGNTKADVLWDAATQKLYVASHQWSTNAAANTTSSSWGRLYRYSYNAGTKTYSLDSGFPVNIVFGTAEATVLAKDSTGRLWITFVQNGRVMISSSSGDDLVWTTPFELPVGNGAAVATTDDISSIIAFGGDKIGVMWSNQVDFKMYFAVHRDGDPDHAWSLEIAYGASADDHINLKSDSSGRVFAAVKTSLTTTGSPLVPLLVRGTDGQWAAYIYGYKGDHHTRAFVALDEQSRKIYMFATYPEAGGAVYYKVSDLDNIAFPEGVGQVFIKSDTDVNINNASSTKQNITGESGLLVVASDSDTRYYFHHRLAGSGGPVANGPTANAMAVTTSENTPIAITLTATDPNNDPLTYTVVGGPTHGTLSGAAPDLIYTPTAGYNGPDSFTFKANDGTTDSAAATVLITVTGINDAPSANGQSVSGAEDTPIAITLSGSDPDGDNLSFTVVTAPSHGTLTGTAPNLSYVPAANYNGPDSFTYVANDGVANSAPATVDISVAAVNDAPVAAGATFTTSGSNPVSGTLRATDVDSPTLTFRIVSNPKKGSVALDAASGAFTYTPGAKAKGADTFSFQASDGLLWSNTATITLQFR